jgi:hypothetical protein
VQNRVDQGELVPLQGPQRSLERIQQTLRSFPGVSDVAATPETGTLDATYSGAFEKIEELEKAIARTGVHCALVSPVIVKFRPYNQDDDAKVLSALQGVAGNVGAAKIAGNFCLFVPADSLDIPAILEACRGAGHPGVIVSHDHYELSFEGAGDAAKLEQELGRTKFVLRWQVDAAAKVVRVAAVRGRCSRASLKKLVEGCGFKSS